MKRLFLLFCLIPALLLCGCVSVPAAESQSEETQATEPEDIEQYLCDIAAEVTLAYGYGKFEDVEKYMLYSFDEQIAMLFPGQSAPYQYDGYTFDSKEAIADAVRSQLISGENPDFTITVTDTYLELYPDGDDAECFGSIPENTLINPYSVKAEASGTVTVSLSLESGEESTGEMKVHFLLVDGQWKVYSPTVAGYFLQLYKPSAPAAQPAN